MAEGENENVIGFDVSQVEAGLKTATKLFNEYGNQLLNVATIQARVNESGLLMVTSMQGLTTAGQKFSASFAEVDEKLKLVSVSLKNTSQTFTENALTIEEAQNKISRIIEIGDDKQIELEVERRVQKIAADQKLFDEFHKEAEEHKKNQIAIGRILTLGTEEQKKEEDQRIADLHEHQTKLRTELESQVRLYKAEQQRISDLMAIHRAPNILAAAYAGVPAPPDIGALTSRLQGGINFGRATPEQINSINKAMAQLVSNVESGSVSLTRFDSILKAVASRSLTQFSGAEQKVVDDTIKLRAAVGELGNETAEFGKQATQTKSVLIDWTSIARFFQFRLLYAGFHQLTTALRDAALASAEFQIKVSEIRTISQDNQLSADQWAESIKRLSDQFGQPVAQVAEGVYETLSNQIAKGAEATRFLSQAMMFGATTVSTTEESVNLLSSALNSFHINVEQTERVASVFFKTIDLGRVRASEMANSFGRVAALGESVGATFEEVNAAIATLTIQGIKPAETFTLINQVMTKLIKPTTEMKKLFDEWGVSTGEQAVATFGFAGVLHKVEEAAHGSSTEFAELFKDIRAIRGAIGLTGSAFQDYEKNLNKITNDALPQYRKAQEIAFESQGKQLEIEFNKIKNLLLDDGKAIVDWVLYLGKIIGGEGGLSGAVNRLTIALKLALEVYVAFKIVRTAENLLTQSSIALKIKEVWSIMGQASAWSKVKGTALTAISAMKTGLSSLLTASNAIVAGVTVFLIVWEKQREAEATMARAREDALETLNRQYKQSEEQYVAMMDAETAATVEAIKLEFQARLQYAAAVKGLLDKALEDQIQHVEAEKEVIKVAFDLYTEAMRKSLSDLESEHRKTLDNIKNAENTLQELKDKAAGKTFEIEVEFATPEEKVKIVQKRIADLRAEFATLLQPVPGATPDQVAENLKRARERAVEVGNLLREQAREHYKIVHERTELEKRVTEIQAKQAANQEIAGHREKARDLQRAGRTVGGTKGRAITEQKDIASKERDAESERREAHELAAAQEKLALLNAQDKLLPDVVKLKQEIADLEKQGAAATAANMTALQAAAKAQEKIIAQRQKEMKELRESFDAILKFKLPKEIKTDTEAKDALAEYDKLSDAAVKAGLVNQQTQFEIQKYRVELSKQADLEVKQHTLKTQAETYAEIEKKLTKQREEIDNATKTNTEKSQTALKILGAKYEELTKIAAAHGGGGTAGMAIAESLKRYKEAFNEYERTGAFGDLMTASKAFAQASSDIEQAATAWGGRGPEDVVVAPATGTGAARTLKDVNAEAGKAMADLVKAQGTANELAKTRAAVEAAEKAAGISRANIQKNIDDAANAMLQYGEKYRDEINRTTLELKDLAVAVSQTALLLRQPGPPGPSVAAPPTPIGPIAPVITPTPAGPIPVAPIAPVVPFRPPAPLGPTAPPVGAPPSPAPIQPHAMNLNVGGVNVYLNSKGSAALDGKAIAASLNDELRKGGVVLNSPREA